MYGKRKKKTENIQSEHKKNVQQTNNNNIDSSSNTDSECLQYDYIVI